MFSYLSLFYTGPHNIFETLLFHCWKRQDYFVRSRAIMSHLLFIEETHALRLRSLCLLLITNSFSQRGGIRVEQRSVRMNTLRRRVWAGFSELEISAVIWISSRKRNSTWLVREMSISTVIGSDKIWGWQIGEYKSLDCIYIPWEDFKCKNDKTLFTFSKSHSGKWVVNSWQKKQRWIRRLF